jgi:hypothetical protein
MPEHHLKQTSFEYEARRDISDSVLTLLGHLARWGEAYLKGWW